MKNETTETLFNNIITSDLFRLDGKAIDLCSELIKLCDAINSEDETDWYIGEFGGCTLDSLLSGAYWALTKCHAGQYSDSYATMCSIGTIFNPGMTDGPEPDSSEKYAYDVVCDYVKNKSE